MNPRTGVILGAVMLVLYSGISMMSGSKGDRYRQEEVSRSRAGSLQNAHSPSEAYLLIINQAIAPGTDGAFFDDEVKEALRRMLETAMDDTGLNRADHMGLARGDLGEVRATVTLMDREYKGQKSQSFQRWSLPYYFKLDLEVSTNGGSSTWDDAFSAEVEISAPSKLAQGTLLDARSRQIDSLMEAMQEKLESRGLFHRY